MKNLLKLSKRESAVALMLLLQLHIDYRAEVYICGVRGTDIYELELRAPKETIREAAPLFWVLKSYCLPTYRGKRKIKKGLPN